ncbi:MAG: SNF2-related protein [Polyangia bacterium]
MRPASQSYAARGVQLLEIALQKQPPPGLSAGFVRQFFGQYRGQLQGELARILDQFADQRQVQRRPPQETEPRRSPASDPPAEVVRWDRGESGDEWARLRPEDLRPALQRAAQQGQGAVEWLTARIRKHRPDLVKALDVAAGELVQTLLPADMPPDEWPASARTAANVAAIQILASGAALGPSERTALLRYSGWGGLSIDAVAERLPADWLPESRGLIHEYYTPTVVAREMARVLRPMIPGLPSSDGTVWALEPSAGIGRLVHACSGSGFEALHWTAVEYSRVSAKLLAAVRPDLAVFEGPFERWLVDNEAEVRGKLGLVVSNPPYGERGATITEDADKAYRENKAYAYFLRRGLDLLAAGGVGVFLIPYGFLTGQSAGLLALRERVLKRHHLMAAFRLPSKIFPGANLVTDLLFFRARGGELPEVLPDDLPLLQGKYFEQFPTHILGVERGKAEDEDDTTRKPRWGYEVDGTFTALPDFTERSMCTTCAVAPFYTAPERPRKKPSRKESLPPHLQAAITLGDRVAHYLGALANGEEASVRTAAALYPELRDALLAWSAARAAEASEPRLRSPYADRLLVRESKSAPELVSFLSAFEENGDLAAAFQSAPVHEPRYQGTADDVVAQAEFLYRTRRRLTLDVLREFRRTLGIVNLNEPLHTALIGAEWCFDGGEWQPGRDYFTGLLWPKYDRAKALADQGDAQAAAQAAKLLETIRPIRFSDIAPEPRMPWVPLDGLRAWLEEWTDAAVPPLVRENGLLRLEESTYTHLKDVAGQRLSVAVGYLNHDFTLFTPPASKQVDPTTGEEESSQQALSRARIDYGERAKRSFQDFIGKRPELMQQVEEAYNRVFRGYVTPQYGAEELHIARWRGRIVLKPHQRAGAQRLIAHNGGLLGFDVGVGKTYTGIATLAALRQAGRAKRPVVLVPNTIIWKWFKELRAALPDYRVLVLGSERYVGRNGVYTSRIDTPQERAMKWRQFQAGEFDVALVTYSVFARNRLRAESVRQWILETPALLRTIGLTARNMLAGLKEKEGDEEDTKAKKRKIPISAAAIEKFVGAEKAKTLTDEERAAVAEKLAMQKEKEREAENARLLSVLEAITDLSERERAIFHEAMERWIAERLEMNEEPDPGIYWEDLQCDLLLLDEAQNMKNLWPVQQREGGIPKYLGAITEGSDRAWNFALRAALVRQRTGGSGVVLLSATPAKNSPLEYYTLLGYVDGQAWTRLGITDPEVFIDRYLRLELKDIIGTDLKTQRRSIVAGFQNLDELRDVVFRYAEFRTAEEVGLKLPETQVEQIRVPMSEAQTSKYERYLEEYEQALKRGSQDPKMRLKALGLLQRMALVAIHPELDSGPPGSREATTLDELSLVDTRVPDEELQRRVQLLRLAGTSVEAINAMSNEEIEAAYRKTRASAPVDLFRRWMESTETLRKRAEEKFAEQQARAGRSKSGKAKEQWTWQNARLVLDPSCPKLDKAVEYIVVKPECGHLIFCDNVPVHYWLKTLLVIAGIPEARIAIFNAETAPGPARRQALAEGFNGVPPVLDEDGNVEQEGIPPLYDIVIANATAYEGIDLHVRTCQVYHIDLPWEPATLQQRNGRAVRQGNQQAVIKIYYLLSERSMDAVRFSMILGKLNWMKDILKSADRETNNPGAQAEMNPEELLLYLARDPEQARAAIEQQKKMLEEETRQRVRRQAWTSLRGIASRAQSLARVTDDLQRAQVHREMDELRSYLSQVPAETWPWFFLVDVARQGTPMLFGTDWALPSGGVVVTESSGAIEVGEIRGESIGVRLFGDLQWHAATAEKLAQPEPPPPLDRVKRLLAEARPDDFRYGTLGWNEGGDVQEARPRIQQALRRLERGDFDALGLDLASARWRTWLWHSFGAAILQALSQAPRSMDFRMPLGNSGAAFGLVYGDELPGRVHEVLSFEVENFSRFIELASASGYKWSELHATAMAWWSRPFPRGILKEPDTGTLIEIRTGEGTMKVRAVWQSPYFAVTYMRGRGPDHPDGPLFNVTHIPSGMAAAQSFQSADSARSAAQFLASLPTNWESNTPDTSVLPKGLSGVLAWVRSQKTAPTLDEITQRAAGR